MTEKSVIPRSDRGQGLSEMIREIGGMHALTGIVSPSELAPPEGVERSGDESVQRRVAMCLIKLGLEGSTGPDAVEKALKEASIPIAVYEQAVQQPGFHQLYMHLHKVYVVIPQVTEVAQAIATRAKTGESGSFDRFFRLLSTEDDELNRAVKMLEAQGGNDAILEAIQSVQAELAQLARDVSCSENERALRDEAIQLANTRSEADVETPQLSHAELYEDLLDSVTRETHKVATTSTHARRAIS